MAEEFQDVRRLYYGDVLVERPAPSTVSGIMNHLDMKSRIGNRSGNPSTSKDPQIDGSSGHHHHHHHHPPRKHRSSKGRVKKDYGNAADRFSRTASVLRHSGLLKLTLQIAQLMKTNEDLQKEIDDLQREAVEFSENLKSQIQQKLSGQNDS